MNQRVRIAISQSQVTYEHVSDFTMFAEPALMDQRASSSSDLPVFFSIFRNWVS
jgi:hypothetical protein